MDKSEKHKTIEYFSFWRVQNKITLFALIAILTLSILLAVGIILLPSISTIELVAFIVLIPTLACFGIATGHSSNLESAKALREYKRLSERLAETEGSQISLDRFFSISSDLMAVAGKDGLLKKVSRSLVNTLGYSEETLLTTPFFQFIHPDDIESTRKNIEALHLGLRSVGFVNRYRAANGTYRTLSWSAAADAELGVRFASARDITEERNFQNRVQQILDSVPFLVMVKDMNGIITDCNTAFAWSVGISRDLLVGQNINQFLTSESMLTSMEKEQEVMSTQNPQTFSEIILDQTRKEKYLSTVFPIFDTSKKIVSIGKVSLKIEAPTEH